MEIKSDEPASIVEGHTNFVVPKKNYTPRMSSTR